MISSLQRVTSAPNQIQSCAAGYENSPNVLIFIIEAFKEIAPVLVFVNFIENPNGRFRVSSTQNALPILGIIPIEIGILGGELQRESRLAYLARAANKNQFLGQI